MQKRDLNILDSLEKFKCLERDQIAELHFSQNANPIVNCNRVLKRLRDQGYIQANTNRAFKQYVYFLKPSTIKIDSQKIDHYLMIAQGYIDMHKIKPVSSYLIEPKIQHAKFIPDVYCQWIGKRWFLEYQNSFYTTNQLINKLEKYVEYFKKGYWKDERVLIIGKVNKKFDTRDFPFKFRQIESIDVLKDEFEKFNKYQSKIKCNGMIKWQI
ncbi:UNVERIFIED_ORG: hypothetical protein ABRZ91_001762 [Heyndrickxia coagulans]